MKKILLHFTIPHIFLLPLQQFCHLPRRNDKRLFGEMPFVSCNKLCIGMSANGKHDFIEYSVVLIRKRFVRMKRRIFDCAGRYACNDVRNIPTVKIEFFSGKDIVVFFHDVPMDYWRKIAADDSFEDFSRSGIRLEHCGNDDICVDDGEHYCDSCAAVIRRLFRANEISASISSRLMSAVPFSAARSPLLLSASNAFVCVFCSIFRENGIPCSATAFFANILTAVGRSSPSLSRRDINCVLSSSSILNCMVVFVITLSSFVVFLYKKYCICCKMSTFYIRDKDKRFDSRAKGFIPDACVKIVDSETL